jgi:hydroxymethylglutaryl-CoA lyase
VVEKWIRELDTIGVKVLSLSDTIGIATPESVHSLFSTLIPAFAHISFGAHLHTTPVTWRPKVEAAFKAGCVHFDGAIKGFGGCPMAEDKLTGNMPTENILSFLEEQGVDTGIHHEALAESMLLADRLFSTWH